jgi:transposase
MDTKKSNFRVKSNRYFSDDFKKQKVKEITSKKITIREVSIIYDVAVQTVYKWLYKYSTDYQKQTKVVVEMESEAQKTLFYKDRVADLERLIGQKQIQIEFLEKLIEIASEEFQTDVKKKFSPKLLNGFDNTSKILDSQ